MSKEKAFVILTPGFPSSEDDSTCLPMQQQFVKAISSLHLDVEVIVLSFQYPFRRQTYKWFDATVISFNGKNKGGATKIFLRRKIHKRLNRLHKEKQIIGMLSFWLGECAYVGKKFADDHGLIHYCWLMGQDAKANNNYCKKISVKDADLIALSDSLVNEFEKNYKIKPFTVITPGVGETVSEEENLRDIDLLAVGSLIPLKRFEIFIRSVEKIKQHIPGIKAVIVGDGPEKKYLLKCVADLNLEENVSFAGSIGHAQVLAMMQRTKILLHPSAYEGYSGVCQEALSNGAHVISFCRAMSSEIEQWHIVESQKEMVKLSIDILTGKSTNYKKIRFQPMSATVHQLMKYYL